MDHLDCKASEAMAVDQKKVQDVEVEESRSEERVVDFSVPLIGTSLNLSPHTWSTIEDMPDSFWDSSYGTA
jgi:hypothetical protein